MVDDMEAIAPEVNRKRSLSKFSLSIPSKLAPMGRKHSSHHPTAGGLAQGNYSFVCKGALPKDGILFQPVIGEHCVIEQRIGSQ